MRDAGLQFGMAQQFAIELHLSGAIVAASREAILIDVSLCASNPRSIASVRRNVLKTTAAPVSSTSEADTWTTTSARSPIERRRTAPAAPSLSNRPGGNAIACSDGPMDTMIAASAQIPNVTPRTVRLSGSPMPTRPGIGATVFMIALDRTNSWATATPSTPPQQGEDAALDQEASHSDCARCTEGDARGQLAAARCRPDER
jgi:hypothetical protein